MKLRETPKYVIFFSLLHLVRFYGLSVLDDSAHLFVWLSPCALIPMIFIKHRCCKFKSLVGNTHTTFI